MPTRIRFNSCGVAVYPPGASFGPRQLDDHEFVWIIDGSATWQVDGQAIQAGPGSVLLGRPGMRDAFIWDPRQRTRHGYLHFAWAGGSRRLPPPAQWPLHRSGPASAVLPTLFSHLGWLFGQRPVGWERLAVRSLDHALEVFVSGHGGCSDIVDADAHPAILAAFAQVRKRWADGLMPAVPLAELCRAARVSPVKLTRIFHAELGTSPVMTLRLLRLDHAADLLARGYDSVERIAVITGFADAFHFSRAFRSRYGMAPTAFRQHLRSGGSQTAVAPVRIRRLWSAVWQGAEATRNRALREIITPPR